MPKNVESSIRIVGSKPGDLDEITENSEQEKNRICSLSDSLDAFVTWFVCIFDQ